MGNGRALKEHASPGEFFSRKKVEGEGLVFRGKGRIFAGSAARCRRATKRYCRGVCFNSCPWNLRISNYTRMARLAATPVPAWGCWLFMM